MGEEVPPHWRQDPVARHAPALLARPGARVADVAAALGMSERQLHRRFVRAVGLPPSAYRRLVRARYALRDLCAPAGSEETIAAIAHRRGYTTRHLTREVVAMTRLTPARLR